MEKVYILKELYRNINFISSEVFSSMEKAKERLLFLCNNLDKNWNYNYVISENGENAFHVDVLSCDWNDNFKYNDVLEMIKNDNEIEYWSFIIKECIIDEEIK